MSDNSSTPSKDDEGFVNFMKRVDGVLKLIGGLGFDSMCYADAPWRDLYDDLGEECDDDIICDTLAEWDDNFAAILELHREGQDDA